MIRLFHLFIFSKVYWIIFRCGNATSLFIWAKWNVSMFCTICVSVSKSWIPIQRYKWIISSTNYWFPPSVFIVFTIFLDYRVPDHAYAVEDFWPRNSGCTVILVYFPNDVLLQSVIIHLYFEDKWRKKKRKLALWHFPNDIYSNATRSMNPSHIVCFQYTGMNNW